MPQFHITTLETWEHRVGYVVDAATLAEAYEQICGQQHAYSRQDVVESGDKVLFMMAACSDEAGDLEVPHEFSETAQDAKQKREQGTAYCVFHEWPGDYSFFLADTEEEAERIVVAIVRDRLSGAEDGEYELEPETIEGINSPNHAEAYHSVPDFCSVADESFEIHPIAKYFSKGNHHAQIRSAGIGSPPPDVHLVRAAI